MRDESFYLRDIIDAAADIEEILDGISQDQFFDSKTVRWAVIQRLGVIGEAAARLSEELKNRHPEIEWDRIKGARNVFVHAYFKIDWDIIWDTVSTRITPLKQKAIEVIQAEYPDNAEDSES